MATYKVIQDIEAEDKLVGPFSLRQFIYLAIVLILGFIAYSLAKASIVLAIPFVLPILFFGALATPFSQDQSTEVWLLAKIRFLLKPRRRIWNQDGIKELVTITVPKKEEHVYTDGLSQTEVKSRLNALATTLDSRGWAVKNASLEAAPQAGYLTGQGGESDRLVGASALPQEVPDQTALDAIDMMDAQSSATAQNLDRMIQQKAQTRRQDVVSKMQQPAEAQTAQKQTPADYWFMQQQKAKNKTGFDSFGDDKVVHPGSTDEENPQTANAQEEELISRATKQKAESGKYSSHLKTIQPLSDKPQKVKSEQNQSTASTDTKPQAQQAPNPDIMRLASDNDKNISTIAREANRGLSDGEEVEVSLH